VLAGVHLAQVMGQVRPATPRSSGWESARCARPCAQALRPPSSVMFQRSMVLVSLWRALRQRSDNVLRHKRSPLVLKNP
jgi:hypothetical protein